MKLFQIFIIFPCPCSVFAFCLSRISSACSLNRIWFSITNWQNFRTSPTDISVMICDKTSIVRISSEQDQISTTTKNFPTLSKFPSNLGCYEGKWVVLVIYSNLYLWWCHRTWFIKIFFKLKTKTQIERFKFLFY